MLHKPKISTLKHLHSIPRYFMHSIPIGSIVALLTLTLFTINPSPHDIQAYAIEDTNVRDTISTTNSNNDLDTVEREDSTVSKANGGANDTTSTASLTIGGTGLDDITPATAGEVAYRKHTITVDAPNSEEYYLIINGPTSLTGSTTIGGADNKTPEEMLNNSWGYAYSDTNTEDTLNYQSFTGSAETIDSGTGPTNFTKNLIFAAKFGSDAVSGHYTGQVTLSLASTPGEVVLPTNPVETWDELQSMQQMTSKACADGKTGAAFAKTLTDSRDNSTYTIQKLDDQNCWMTTNLRLTGDSLQANGHSTTITSEDSNVMDDYPVPESSQPWKGTLDDANKVNYSGNTTNGAYYTYCAATAGSCAETGESSASICPKGWRLPTSLEYTNLVSKDGGWNDSLKGRTLAGGFFPAAGYILSNSIQDVDSQGFYWSKKAASSEHAYVMYLDSNRVAYDATPLNRVRGFSVRCIAMTEQDEKGASFPLNLTTMQGMNSTICNNADIGAQRVLADTRDDNTYMIQKLEDDRCWMVQNLRITGDSIKAKEPSNITGTITSTNSNVDSDYKVPMSSKPWNSTTVDANGNRDETAQFVHYAGIENNGAYYTYCAATANSCLGATQVGDTVTDSICSKGWRLPTKQEYDTLLSKGYGEVDAVEANKGLVIAGGFFAAAGGVENNSVQGVGSFGGFWSSTADGRNRAYYLISNNSYIGVTPNNRDYGMTVRCIAK